MTDPDEDFAPPPPRSRFRRLRKVALWMLGIFGAVVLALFLGRWQVGRVGAERLRIETARLDKEDPGWNLDAILAERQKNPPDAQTAATEVLKIAEDLPNDWKMWRNSDDAMKWWARRCDNHLPPKDATDIARKHAADTLFLRAEAIRLREKSPGQFPLTIAPDPIATLLPHLDKCRQVLSLLQYDAYLAVLDKNPNRAISAARAALAVGRAIGDEPLLVSQLVRIASVVLAAQTAMQVIAWGVPTDGLAELQAELLAEAEVPYFRIGMRGERATIDRVFRGLEDGSIPAEHWFRYAEIQNPGPEHYAAFKTYRAFIPGDHAKALEILSKYLDAAKLPHPQQLAAMNAVPIPPGAPEEFRYILTRLLLPACHKVAEAGLRARAELLAAATGIACERFRQKHGRWPESPAELVPAFLPAVPINPFDGKPISYRVFGDRIAVYFFWADSPRKAEELPEDFRDGPAGAVFGSRLWNPDRRTSGRGEDRSVIRRIVGLVERRTRVVKLPRAEVDFLLGHARHLIELVPTFEKHIYRLTARGYVGSIDGPETRYAIAPKLPWKNICSLLGLPPERSRAAAAPAGGLIATLAEEFANRLDEVVKTGLVPGYGEAEGVSTFLRGKLRAADQMRDAAAQAFPDKFHVDEPVFDLHTPWNRIPKATASALLRRAGLLEDVRQRVESASVPLGPVPDVPATEVDFAAALAEPRATAYRPLLDLCRFILTGLNAANPLGTETGAFLVDLGRAFERYMTDALGRALAESSGWTVEPQPRFTLGPTELQPDMIVRENGNTRAVIDVKWKTANPEAADLHQVLAYATLTGAPHVALVYPGVKYERAHFTTPDGRLRVSLVRVRVVGSSSKLERSIQRFARCL